ncbi:MAG: glucarate dehydratase [Saprospiraceae bacterium]|nr:glucarate dehydratase [Saprospiraceae bacterium]
MLEHRTCFIHQITSYFGKTELPFLSISSDHQISNIICTPVAIGDPPLLNAAGLHAPYALRIIVEVETRSGISGISEIPGSEKILQTLWEVTPSLIGQQPSDLTRLHQILSDITVGGHDERGDNPWDQRTQVHVFSAIEVACLDIMGKIMDCPVYELLGGKVRDAVPFAAYLFYKYEGAGGSLGFDMYEGAQGWSRSRQKPALTPHEIVDQALAMVESFGFQSIKLKGGVFEPGKEVDAIMALRETFGPSMPLRYDPNALWSMDTARKWGPKMEGVLEYFEDPVRGQKKMATLRKELKMPFATNMCTTSFEEIPSSIRLHSEDIILSDHHFWGGMRACLTLHKICRTFGRGFSMHSNSHLGISLAAMVHVGAVVPDMDYALDTHYPWQEDEVIVGGKLPIENGAVRVPHGPGLGVEIDRSALEKLHANYQEAGLKERNDEIEMQKVDPQWKFEATRF